MAKVILICGKICSGKSRYADHLRNRQRAVILSHDELMLAIFDPMLGERHDEAAGRVSAYLYEQAARLAEADVEVILDWGFWTRESRRAAGEYFMERGIPVEWHYVHAEESLWRRNIKRRNCQVETGEAKAYPVDEGLLRKLAGRFEQPERDEMDVWFVNEDGCIQDMQSVKEKQCKTMQKCNG